MTADFNRPLYRGLIAFMSALLHIESRIFLAVTGLFLGMSPIEFSHLDMMGLKSIRGWKLNYLSNQPHALNVICNRFEMS